MDQQFGQRKSLGSLPASDTEYFTKYEADITKVEDRKPPNCDHYFFYVKAGQVQCKKCYAGLFLNIGDLLKDGHIYSKGKLVI